MADDGELMRLSQTERDVLHLFRTVFAEYQKTSTFSFGTLNTEYGRVNISLFSGRDNRPESDATMPVEQSTNIRHILESLNHLEETRKEADELEKRNRERIGKIMDKVLPDHPYRDDLKKLLEP